MRLKLFPFGILIFLSVNSVYAQKLSLPGIFGDHMILQREMQVPIWGKAKANSLVLIKIDGQSIKTQSDSNGHWKTFLPVLSISKPQTLLVSSNGERIVFKDILVGDVFYAGGQSNMEYELYRANGGEEELKNASFNDIRLFKVSHQLSYTPKFDFSIKDKNALNDSWELCSPKTAKDFSAVAYFFAKKIYEEEKIPVGIIEVAWSGTTIETHMSLEGNKSLPYHKQVIDEIESKTVNDKLLIEKDRPPVLPSSIFNAMIHPLIPFGIKGFIWYQGEQNANYPLRYREQLPAFIHDMRIRWQQGYLPFYFVQIPGVGKKPQKPTEDFWSILRESQLQTLNVTKTAMVVTLDVNEGDLHPKNKKLIGDRLAMLALKNSYGKSSLGQSPIFKSYRVNRDTIEIKFDYSQSGLYFKNDSAKGFSIAAEDQRFYWAKAIITNNNTLKVFSREVMNPKAVRYAWGENPPYSLFNKQGFPASPFRTDDWPLHHDGWWEY